MEENELQQVLDDILEDKTTNLKPENLKLGVTCLGIEGTLEQSSGSDVTPIYETTEYTVKNIPVDLNEEVDSISTYEQYIVVHTTLNKLKVYDVSNLSTPLITEDNIELQHEGYVYIYGFNDNKLYITAGSEFAGGICYIADLTDQTMTSITYENTLISTQNQDLHIDINNNIIHYKHGSYNRYLCIYSYNVDTGFTQLSDEYNAVNAYIGNNVYQNSKNISIIQSDGSKVTSNVVPSNLNCDVCGLNYIRTKAFVYSYDDYKTVYVYSLNDDHSLNELLSTIELSFEFTNGTPIFECLNSNYYYLSYNDNNYILKFDEDTNQFSIVVTNENLYVRNSLPIIQNNNQYIDFQQGDTEIGIMYNGDQYLTRDKYTGYTNSTLLSGNTMYDIAHQIVSGTMANNGDVIITPTTQEQTKEQGYYNSLKVSGVTSDIDSNIIAENIKSGVTILGIEGTLQESTSNIKLFLTSEEMLEDDTAQEGNLGLVYGLSTNNMDIENNATTTKIYFLPSVILPTQITSSFSGSLIYQTFNLNCSLNSTSFICNIVFRGDTTSVEYTSTDGINYTRVTDTDMYEFSYGIELNRFRNWDDNFGYFLQVGGMVFSGLYKYTNNTWELAETQLTFSEASQLTKDIIGYGLNGVITGTLETLDTSDATAQASDIVEGKTAYVNGEKITGSFAPDENLDVSSTVSQQSDITIGDDGFGLQSLIFKGTQSGYYTPKYIKNVTPTVSAEQSMVANAIGLTAEKLVSGNTILGIQGSAEIGTDTSDADAVASDIALNKTAYVNGEKVTGTLPIQSNVLAKKAYNSQDEKQYGQVRLFANNDTKTIVDKDIMVQVYTDYTELAETLELTPDKIVQGNTILGVEGTAIELKGQTKSITPTINLQTIIPDENYNGLTSVKVSAVTSDIDENIKAENIKSGVEILGVTGILEEGIDTSDANATADDIVSPKTAYVNGEKITGTLIKTNFQLSDLQEQGIDISSAVSGNNFVACDNDNTSICIYTPMDLCIGKNSYFPATMSNDYITKGIGLTADKIVQGNTILGIIGTGGAGTEYEPLQTLSTSVNQSNITQENWVTLSGVVSDTGIVTENETTFVAGTTFADLANTIGLTADKIKKGETILGITGTYEGIVSEEEYEQAVDTTEQILGITDNQ